MKCRVCQKECKRTYCSNNCKVKYFYRKRVKAKLRFLICPGCQKKFETYYVQKIFCSHKCTTIENNRHTYERRKRNRRALKQLCVEYLGSKCTRCGIDDFRVMDFHHVESKDTDIAKLINCKNTVVIDGKLRIELSKCVLLCRNCHALTHFEDDTVGNNPFKDN